MDQHRMIDLIIKEASITGAKDEHLPYPTDAQRPPQSNVTRTPVRDVRVQAYVRFGSRTVAMISAVFICKLTTLLSIVLAPSHLSLCPRSRSPQSQRPES